MNDLKDYKRKPWHHFNFFFSVKNHSCSSHSNQFKSSLNNLKKNKFVKNPSKAI